ncbi:unnamed protein product [Brugia timori]|uniref:DUF5641 domain-containing protein n=1 Tax=Brugia timori TaxID=42155 RepID=A0A0R3Q375_9BILA|nr:unnamed protein product [Brugia timori]
MELHSRNHQRYSKGRVLILRLDDQNPFIKNWPGIIFDGYPEEAVC